MNTDQIAAKVATFLPSPVARQIAARRKYLASSAAHDAELARASFARIEERNEAVEFAKTRLGRAEEAFYEDRATERDVAEAKLALKNERAQTAKVQLEIAALVQSAADSKEVVEAVDRSLAGQNWPIVKRPLGHGATKAEVETEGNAPQIELARVQFPDEDLHGIIAAQRSEVARLHDDLAEVDAAPDHVAAIKRQAKQHVDALAARGAPLASGVGVAGGRFRIEGPQRDIGAQPSDRVEAGHIPRSDDALALIAWAMPEKVLEAVEADIEAAYAAVDLQLAPHEKQRRRREIKAAILKAERIECAALWEIVERGDDTVRFRPGTDPRAIFGITV